MRIRLQRGRHSRFTAKSLAWSLVISSLTFVMPIANAPRAEAEPTCTSDTGAATSYTITKLHDSIFYVDSNSDDLQAQYFGYSIQNKTGVTVAGIWVQIGNFAALGTKYLDLAATENQNRSLGDLANGAKTYAYWLVKHSSNNAVSNGANNQTHDVTIYSGDPASGGIAICKQSNSITEIEGSLSTSANVVDEIWITGNVVTDPTFTISVVGATGTLGSGSARDPGVFYMTPASKRNWPASNYQLISTKVGFCNTATRASPCSFNNALDNQLWLGDVSGAPLNLSGNNDYTAEFTFKIISQASSDAIIRPNVNIASGTQVKWTGAYPATAVSVPGPRFSVTYNGNTGTSTVTDSNNYASGSTVTTLFTPTPTLTSYSFGGWCLNSQPSVGSNCTTTTLTSSGTKTFSITANATLYAIWLSPTTTYTVTYDGNTGSTSLVDSSSPYAINSTVTTLFTPIPTLTGYTFSGWCLSRPAVGSTCSGTSYTSSGTETFSITENSTLFAIWIEDSPPPSSAPVRTPLPPNITKLTRADICTPDFEIYIYGNNLSNAVASIDSTDLITKSNNGNRMSVVIPVDLKGKKVISVRNSDGSASKKVNVSRRLPTFSEEKVPHLFVSQRFNRKFSAKGATSYLLTGDLPPGLIFDFKTGEIVGSPKEEGLFTSTITAKGSCGDSEMEVNLYVDKKIPNAISHRIKFKKNSKAIPPTALKELKKFIKKVKKMSPKNVDPVIYVSGGNGPTNDPNDPSEVTKLADDRNNEICDLLLTQDLIAQKIEGIFTGPDDELEIIVYWPVQS